MVPSKMTVRAMELACARECGTHFSPLQLLIPSSDFLMVMSMPYRFVEQ
jgi:hypothetical protein